jgi:hypothetical protein
MSAWKRYFGLDGFDTTVHVVITLAVMAAVVDATRSPGPMALAGAAGLVVLAVRRRLALSAMVKSGEVSGETSGAYRLADVEGRLAELETLHARVAELEERVDFSERLLAGKGEPVRIEAPRA